MKEKNNMSRLQGEFGHGSEPIKYKCPHDMPVGSDEHMKIKKHKNSSRGYGDLAQQPDNYYGKN